MREYFQLKMSQEAAMRTITATEAKNRLGEALSFADNDSLMIQKNNKESCMVFSASMGRGLVLGAYSSGNISRSTAMQLLGLEWYGDLLTALAEAHIPRPKLPAEETGPMVRAAVKTLGSL